MKYFVDGTEVPTLDGIMASQIAAVEIYVDGAFAPFQPDGEAEPRRTLDDNQRESLRMLAAGLDDNWSLDGLTTLLYGVPKRQLGLPLDVKPTPELKVAQREFFSLLYRLLVSRESGPRLPTLLLSLGAARVRTLVGF